MNPVSPRLVLCVLGTVLLTACVSAPTRFYTLRANAEAPPGRTSSLTVTVGPVLIPEAVNRPEMVVQVGAHQVALDELNQWAAPLQADIQRVLIENLVRLLGSNTVFRYPQSPVPMPDFRVQMEVLRFESLPGDAAILDVVWTVRWKIEKEAKTGRTTVREPVQETGYDALVAAHSRALGTLSSDLAQAILLLE